MREFSRTGGTVGLGGHPRPLSSSEARARPAPLAYDPALDGLRAIAVLAVLAYHADLSWASGGFLGVDLFFVLSGYLISTLLLRELASTGRIDLVGFWGRRLRRLVPALVLVVAWVVVYVRWIDPAGADSGVKQDAAASLFYVANWYQIVSDTSYFELLASPTPLLHTWSLAIEEQWYLVWPVAVALWCRFIRSGPMAAAGFLMTLAVASAMLMSFVASPDDPSRAFYGTDTRSGGLLVGAALAFVLESAALGSSVGRRRSFPLSASALAVLAAAVVFISDDDFFMYSGGFLAAAAVAAVAVFGIRLAGPDDPVRRALSVAPLVTVGKVSYGLYLWHWPLFVWLTEERTGLDGLALVVVRLVATAVPTALSYWVVEMPIRRSRLPTFGPLPLTGGLALAAVAAFAALPSARAGEIGDSIRISANELGAAVTVVPTDTDTDTDTDTVDGAARRGAGPAGAAALTATTTRSNNAPSSFDAGPILDPALSAGFGGEADQSSSIASPLSAPGSPPLEPSGPGSGPTVLPGSPVQSGAPVPASPTAPPSSTVPPPSTMPPAPASADVLVLGDSVYLDLVMRASWPQTTKAGTVIRPTADVRLGCGTLRIGLNPSCSDRLGSWQASVREDKPDLVVIGVSSWDLLDVDEAGATLELGSDAHTNMLISSWTDNLNAATATGAPVLVVSLPCLTLENSPDSTAVVRAEPDRAAFVNRTVARVVDNYGGNVSWVELRDFTCPDGRYRPEVGGVKQHRDGIHFTDEAIPVIWNWLLGPIGEALIG